MPIFFHQVLELVRASSKHFEAKQNFFDYLGFRNLPPCLEEEKIVLNQKLIISGTFL